MKEVYFTSAVQNAGLVHQVFVRGEKSIFFKQKSLCSFGRILDTQTRKRC